jgi:hypothetical protein
MSSTHRERIAEPAPTAYTRGTRQPIASKYDLILGGFPTESGRLQFTSPAWLLEAWPGASIEIVVEEEIGYLDVGFVDSRGDDLKRYSPDEDKPLHAIYEVCGFDGDDQIKKLVADPDHLIALLASPREDVREIALHVMGGELVPDRYLRRNAYQ